MTCPICDADTFEKVPVRFRAITSTGKGWGRRLPIRICNGCGYVSSFADADWHSDMARLYEDYGEHPLGKLRTEEGVVSSTLHGKTGLYPRSQVLFDFVSRHGALGPQGRMLDYGCGMGTTLGRFSRELSAGWDFAGFEIDTRQRDNSHAVLGIPGVKQFFSDPATISGKYTLITLLHVLEHIPDPLPVLKHILELLESGGAIAIAVPNLLENPFQLAIADHFSMFTKESLSLLMKKAGFSGLLVDDEIVRKELFLLAARQGAVTLGEVANSRVKNEILLVRSYLQWLDGCCALTKRTFAEHGPMGLFGTSVGGGWFYQQNPDWISFFVDEDPRLVGLKYDGRPILSLNDVSKGAPVIIAQPHPVAVRILTRLQASHPDVNWIATPPLLLHEQCRA